MHKILLTGASGFVGQNLKKFLEKKEDLEIITLNLREVLKPESFSAATSIIHLVGKAHDLKKTNDAREYFFVNTKLTEQLFDLFLQTNSRDFIYFSSVKAVADTVAGVLQEDVIPNPQTVYGKSKQQAETYIMSKVLPEGKRVFILRPCMIHGPGNKGNLNLLYKLVKKRNPLSPGCLP